MNKICNLYELKKDIAAVLAWMSVAFVAGMVLCFVIVKVFEADDPELTTIPLAGLMALIAGGAFLYLYASIALKERFAKAICMSCTRKRFVLRETLEGGIITLVVAAVCPVFGSIDMAVQRNLMGGIPIEFDIMDIYKQLFTNPLNAVMIICIVISCRFLFGELLIKFGNKAFWIIWAVWMLCSLVPAKISNAIGAEKIEMLAGEFAKIAAWCGGYFVQISAIVLSVLMYVIAVRMLTRQEAAGY